jgi:hypothetical protein
MYRRDTYGIHLILIKREQPKKKETIHEKKTNFLTDIEKNKTTTTSNKDLKYGI